MIEQTSNQKPSRIKLVGMNPEKSSAVVERIMAIGRSTLIGEPQKLSSANTPQLGICAELNKIPKGKVKSLTKGITAIAPIICKLDEEENENENENSVDTETTDETDYDEFVDYAKAKIAENNVSYDSASYQDFESLVAESIRAHFQDDEDDDDSLTSIETFSGYDHDVRSKNLEENSLISDSSYHRLRGAIAKKKGPVQKQDTPKDIDESREQNYVVSTVTSFEETIDDETTVTKNSVSVMTSDDGKKNAYPDVPPQYLINPDENSLISMSSYRPKRRRRKRRNRKAKSSRLNDSSSSANDGGWGLLEHTMDDLAFYLAQASHREGRLARLLSSGKKNKILEDIKEKKPDLYNAVVERINEENKSVSGGSFSTSVVEGNESFQEAPDFRNSLLECIDEEGVAESEFSPMENFNVSPRDNGSPEASLVLQQSAHLEKSYRIYCGTPDKTYEADKSNDGHNYDLSAYRKSETYEDAKGVSQDESYQDRLFSSLSSPDAARLSHPNSSPSQGSPLENTTFDFWEEDTVLEISVDGQSISVPTVESELATILESSQLVEGEIDEMIEDFLSGKIDRVSRRLQERQVVQARRSMVLEEIKMRSNKEGESSVSDGVSDESIPSTDRVEHKIICERSRALIRKIQSKRKALAIAKELEESGAPLKDDLFDRDNTSRNRVRVNARKGKRAETIVHIPDDGQNEFEFQNFVVDESPESPGRPIDEKWNRIIRLKARKRSSRHRRRISSEKPLHESLNDPVQEVADDDLEKIENVFKSPFSPSSAAVMNMFSRKQPNNTYEALSETDSSFGPAGDYKSEDILSVLVPPSPESPIRDYTLSNASADFHAANASSEAEPYSLADYFSSSVDNSDRSAPFETSTPRASMYIGTKANENSPGLQVNTDSFSHNNDRFDDSFDAIVMRKKHHDTEDVSDNPFVVVQRPSPTSVADFFGDNEISNQGGKTNVLAFAYDEEEDPVFVDEDDHFVHPSNRLEYGGILEPGFLSPSRFEV